MAFESRQKISAMIGLAASELEVAPETLDADWSLLAVENGVLHLQPDGTTVLKEARPDHLITLRCATAYVGSRHCAKFEEALVRALPDPEVRDYLQRLGGYTLHGG